MEQTQDAGDLTTIQDSAVEDTSASGQPRQSDLLQAAHINTFQFSSSHFSYNNCLVKNRSKDTGEFRCHNRDSFVDSVSGPEQSGF